MILRNWCPLPVLLRLNPQIPRMHRTVNFALDLRQAAGHSRRLHPNPSPKLLALGHALKRGPFVNVLATFVARFPYGTGRRMNNPYAGLRLILVLAALTSGSERIYAAVCDGYGY